MALSMTLVGLMSGTIVAPANANPLAQEGRSAQRSAQRSSQTKQAQWAEILRERTAAAAHAKEKLNQIKATAREITAATHKQKSQKTKVSFFFSSTGTEDGIVGGVSDKATGAVILFESKREGENLTSRIKDLTGKTLIEYVEVERALVIDPLTRELLSEPAPVLRINDVQFLEMQGPIVDYMRNFATSPEGALLRLLALYLEEYVPGEDLEMERRGLEVPYQAMQSLYEKLAINEYGGGELRAARNFGAKRSEAFKNKEFQKQREPLAPQPVDCQQFQCLYVDNHDYLLSAQGGYVVKSLSPRLALSHNFAPPEIRVGDEHHDHLKAESIKEAKLSRRGFKAESSKSVKSAHSVKAAPINCLDDDSQVGDCFGRCGPGCGNWTHAWIGEITPYIDYTYCEPPDPNNFMPDCSSMCCSNERRVTSYSGMALHTAHGKVTLGSQAHDSCVRDLGGPAWLLSLPGMPCFGAALLAIDCAIPGVGEEHTWSYIGPHAEGYDYYTGNCCVAIGPVN